MKVLITGGAGYIGSHTVVAASAKGHDVAILDNFSRGHHDAVRRASELCGKPLDIHEGDLCDSEFVADTLSLGFDAVVHVAAYKSVGESVEHPEWYERNNAVATSVLCEAIRASGTPRAVYASTGGAYGDGDRPFRESDPLRPPNPYAATKAHGEQSMLALSDVCGVAAMRFFNVCGAHPSGQLGEYPSELVTNLLPVLLNKLAADVPSISVFGNDWPTRDGTCIRDYVHVMDVAEALVTALERRTDTPGYNVYNVGTGRGTTVLEMIKAVESVAKVSFRVDMSPRRLGDPAVVTADTSKANDELGWKARFDRMHMAESATAWARNIS
jgi:UDP-glucose 4-epimerase